MEYENLTFIQRTMLNRSPQSHLLCPEFLEILRKNFDASVEGCLTVTKGFQVLFQITADVMDARELVVDSGLIPEDCEVDEAIGILYAIYLFNLYEKEFSPLMGFKILKTYCREIILEMYSFSYKPVMIRH